ncbi:MAG: hypothetical protein V1911_02850 [Candidatus Micrarchaeota archaeon]
MDRKGFFASFVLIGAIAAVSSFLMLSQKSNAVTDEILTSWQLQLQIAESSYSAEQGFKQVVRNALSSGASSETVCRAVKAWADQRPEIDFYIGFVDKNSYDKMEEITALYKLEKLAVEGDAVSFLEPCICFVEVNEAGEESGEDKTGEPSIKIRLNRNAAFESAADFTGNSAIAVRLETEINGVRIITLIPEGAVIS